MTQDKIQCRFLWKQLCLKFKAEKANLSPKATFMKNPFISSRKCWQRVLSIFQCFFFPPQTRNEWTWSGTPSIHSLVCSEQKYLHIFLKKASDAACLPPSKRFLLQRISSAQHPFVRTFQPLGSCTKCSRSSPSESTFSLILTENGFPFLTGEEKQL